MASTGEVMLAQDLEALKVAVVALEVVAAVVVVSALLNPTIL